MKILKFRRIPDEETRQSEHPVLNWIHHSNLGHAIMFMIGLGLVLLNLFIAHSAIAHPYSWTMAQNVTSMVVLRPFYAAGTWMIIFVVFTGGFTFGKAFLGRAIFRVLGKLAYESALITPLMVQLIYSQLPNGLYLQFSKVLELGLGNIVCVMVAAMMLYLMFEYPFRRLLEFTVLPYCSHDQELYLTYLRRQVNVPKRECAQFNSLKDSTI